MYFERSYFERLHHDTSDKCDEMENIVIKIFSFKVQPKILTFSLLMVIISLSLRKKKKKRGKKKKGKKKKKKKKKEKKKKKKKNLVETNDWATA